MKKRVSVYIDEELWEWTKEAAWSMRISASALFEKLVRGEVAFGEHIKWKDAEQLISDGIDEMEVKIKKDVAKSIGAEIDEAKILADGQAELETIRKEHKKKEAIEQNRADIESIMGSSGPLTKEHQTRKKGAK